MHQSGPGDDRDAVALRRAEIDAALDAIVSIDADGRVIEWNRAAEQIFGYLRSHAVGRPVGELIVPEDLREAHSEGLARQVAGAAHSKILGRRLELEAVCADGSLIPIELAITRSEGHGGLRFTAYVRDITARRAAEEALRAERDRSNALAEDQAALRRVAEAVAAEHDPAGVLATAAQEAARLLRGDVGLVYRFQGASAELVGSHGPAAWAAHARVGLGGQGVLAQVAREATPVRTVRDPRLRADPGPDTLTFGSVAAVPVRQGGELWGALVVALVDRRPFPDGAELRLAHFAQLIGLSLANAQERTRLASQAATDPLTGLANHRTFHERLRAEIDRARRHERELSLVMLDLDHFKAVNDTHGHQVGDRVLIEVAARLMQAAHPSELVARIGGEEFALILPETDGLGAFARAEAARDAIASAPVAGVGALTASAGVCSIEHAPSGSEELIRLADGALYWAKVGGRDATYRYSPEVTRELSAEERAERLARSQALAGLRGLARAVDAKDPSTQQHSERVARLVERLALAAGWTPRRAHALAEAGLVHDVGKIGVPDRVLFKPGALDAEEWEMVHAHAALGGEIASEVLSEEQTSWVRGHHERWDGGGYPDGTVGEEIPDGARMLALADAFDVMTGARHYKLAASVDEAIAECRRERGRQFCPTAVDALDTLLTSGGLSADRESRSRAYTLVPAPRAEPSLP